MSQSPCWRRINRFEQDGIILRRAAVLDREKLGMDLVVFTTVKLSTMGRTLLEEFETSVADLPEIVECYTMTGVWQYMLKIIVRDIRHFERFVKNELLSLLMVGETYSHIAVTEIKNTTELPLTV